MLNGCRNIRVNYVNRWDWDQTVAIWYNMYEIIFKERSNNVSGLREKRMTFLLDFYNTIQCSKVKNLEFIIECWRMESRKFRIWDGKSEVSNLAND